jgi:hypothetical protein
MRGASRTSNVVLGNAHILIARRRGVNDTLSDSLADLAFVVAIVPASHRAEGSVTHMLDT